MHDIAIFDRAGRLLGEPTYGSEGDAKDYSNQPVMAPSGLRKVRTIFLADPRSPASPSIAGRSRPPDAIVPSVPGDLLTA